MVPFDMHNIVYTLSASPFKGESRRMTAVPAKSTIIEYPSDVQGSVRLLPPIKGEHKGVSVR